METREIGWGGGGKRLCVWDKAHRPERFQDRLQPRGRPGPAWGLPDGEAAPGQERHGCVMILAAADVIIGFLEVGWPLWTGTLPPVLGSQFVEKSSLTHFGFLPRYIAPFFLAGLIGLGVACSRFTP